MAGEFTNGRYQLGSGSYDLGNANYDLGSTADKKQKKLAGKDKAKAAKSALTSQTKQTNASGEIYDFTAKNQIDADTFKFVPEDLSKSESIRLGSGNTGYSIDAAETRKLKEDGTLQTTAEYLAANEGNAARLDKQIAAWEARTGERLTYDQILDKGAETSKSASEFLRSGSVRDEMFAEDNTFAEEAAKSMGFKDNLEQARVRVDRSGDVGVYGRDIADVINPITGKSLSTYLNNKQDNVGYDTRYNVGKRIEDRAAYLKSDEGVSRKDRTKGEVAGDVANDIGQGFLTAGETATVAADLTGEALKASPILSPAVKAYEAITGEKVPTVLEALSKIGINPKFGQLRENMNEMFSSDATKASKRITAKDARQFEKESIARIKELKATGDYNGFRTEFAELAKGAGVSMKSLWDNPLAGASVITQVLPQLISGGIYGKAVSTGAKVTTIAAAKKAIQTGSEKLKTTAIQKTKDSIIKSRTPAQLARKQTRAMNQAARSSKLSKSQATFIRRAEAKLPKIADKAGTKAGTLTGTLNNIAMEASPAYLETWDRVTDTPYNVLYDNNKQFSDLVDAGVSEEKARFTIAHKEAALVGGATAALTLGISKLTGVGKFEGNLFSKSMAEQSKRGAGNILARTVNSGGRSVVVGSREAGEEGFQGGTQALTTNISKRRTTDKNTDLREGVAEGIGSGIFAGFGSGAGISGISDIPGVIKGTNNLLKDTTNDVTKLVKSSVDTVKTAATATEDLVDPKSDTFNAPAGFDRLFDKIDIGKTRKEKKLVLKEIQSLYVNSMEKAEELQAKADTNNGELTEKEAIELAYYQNNLEGQMDKLIEINDALDAKEEGIDITSKKETDTTKTADIDIVTTLDQIASGEGLDEGIDLTMDYIANTPHGSEKYEENLNKIIVAPNVPAEVKEAAKAGIELEIARKEFKNRPGQTGKTSEEVNIEVLGDGVNSNSKKGLQAHIKRIGYFLKTGNVKAAQGQLDSLNKFADRHQRKAAAIAQGITDAEAEPSKYGTDSSDGLLVFGGTYEITTGSKKELATKIQPEADLLQAEAKFLDTLIKSKASRASKEASANASAKGVQATINSSNSNNSTVTPVTVPITSSTATAPETINNKIDTKQATKYGTAHGKNLLNKEGKFNPARVSDNYKRIQKTSGQEAANAYRAAVAQEVENEGYNLAGSERGLTKARKMYKAFGDSGPFREALDRGIKKRQAEASVDSANDASESTSLNTQVDRGASNKNPEIASIVDEIASKYDSLSDAEKESIDPKDLNRIEKTLGHNGRRNTSPDAVAKLLRPLNNVIDKRVSTPQAANVELELANDSTVDEGIDLETTSTASITPEIQDTGSLSLELADGTENDTGIDLGTTTSTVSTISNTIELDTNIEEQSEGIDLSSIISTVITEQPEASTVTTEEMPVINEATEETEVVPIIEESIVDLEGKSTSELDIETTVLDTATIATINVKLRDENGDFILDKDGKRKNDPDKSRTFDPAKLFKMAKVKVSSIGQIANILTAIKGPKSLAQIVELYKLSNAEREKLLTMLPFIDLFREKIKDTYKETRFDMQAENNPLEMFKDRETGKLPENFEMAAAIASLNWLATRANETTLNSEDDIKGILNLSDSDEFKDSAYELLGEAGVLRSNIISELGRTIREQLGLQIQKNTSGHTEAKTDAQLGLMAIAAMSKMNLIEVNAITNVDLNTYARSDEGQKKTTDENAQIYFVKLISERKKSENGQESYPTATDAVRNYINSFIGDPTSEVLTSDEVFKSLYDKMFNIEVERGDPLDEPTTTAPKILKGTNVETSKETKDAVIKQQSVPYVVKEKMGRLLKLISPDSFKRIYGYVEDMSSIHATQEVSQQAKNDSIAKEYESGSRFALGRKFSKPFYFAYTVYRNMRTGDKSGNISMARSKLHRFLFAAQDWEVNLNILSDKDEDVLAVGRTKIAIAEGLGYGADKTTHNTILKGEGGFDSTIMAPDGTLAPDGKYTAAVKILQKALADSNELALTPEEEIIVEAATNAGGEQLHSLDSLIAIGALSEALLNKSPTVSISVGREIDGTTNGVISAALQLGLPLDVAVKILEAGGVSFDTSNMEFVGEYPKWKEAANKDNYQQLAVLIKADIDERLSTVWNDDTDPEGKKRWQQKQLQNTQVLINDIVDAEGGVTKEGRALSKSPLMLTIYAAQIKGIKEQQANEALDNLYSSMMKARKADTNDPNKARQVALLRNLQKVLPGIIIEGRKLENITDAGIAQWVINKNIREFVLSKKDEERFKKAIFYGLGASTGNALDEYLGNTMGRIELLNNIVNTGNALFMLHYNKAIKAAIDAAIAKGSDSTFYPSKDAIAEIMIKLRDKGFLPGGKHATSRGHKDSLEILNMTNEIVQDSEGGKVKQDYKTDSKSQLKVNKISIDPKTNKTVKTRESISTTSERIKKKIPKRNAGVKALGAFNQSNDGNTQIRLMALGKAMLNLFDAGMYNPAQATEMAKNVNKIFKELQTNYSYFQSAVDKVDHLINSVKDFSDSDLSEVIDGMIEDNVISNEDTITLYRAKELSPKEVLIGLRKEYKEKAADVKTANDKIHNKIIAMAQFPDTGGAWLKKITNSDTGATEVIAIPMDDMPVDLQAASDARYAEENPVEAGISGSSRRTVAAKVGENWVEGYEVEYEGLNSAVVYKVVDGWRIVDKATGSLIVKGSKTRKEALSELTEIINTTHGGDPRMLNKSIYGSEQGTMSDFTPVYTKTLNSSTLLDTFDSLGGLSGPNGGNNTQETPEHSSYLRGVMLSLVKPAFAKLDDLLFEYGETTDSNKGQYIPNSNSPDKIYVAGSKSVINSAIDMSEQEVFAHESIHAIWTYGINNHPKIRKELVRLFNIARRNPNITPEVFLRRDNNGRVLIAESYEKELEKATARYEYVFNSKKNPDAYLHEFATIGLTNASFIGALGELDAKRPEVKYSGGLVSRLGQLIANIINAIHNRKYRNSDGRVNVALMDLALKSNQIQRASDSKINQFNDKFNKYNSIAAKALQDKIWEPYVAFANKRAKTSAGAGRVSSTITAVVGLPAYAASEDFRKQMSILARRAKLTQRNAFIKLMRELRGATAFTQRFYTLLMKNKHDHDQVRERMYQETAKQIEAFFAENGKPTKTEWRELTAGTLKTDLSSILDQYSIDNIKDLMTDPKKLKQEIRKQNIALTKYKKNGFYYKNQAKNLGYIMATGKSGMANGLMNAFNIANVESVNQLAKEGDTKQAEKIIDTLATLYAIQFTPQNAKDTTVKFLTQEYGADRSNNGMRFLMGLHTRFKEDSKRELFSDNPRSMVKGYTFEDYNEFRDMRVGTKADAKAFAKEGYFPVETLDKDKNSSVTTKEMIMYVSKDGNLNKRVSGILSTTERHSKGTALPELFLQSGSTTNPNAASNRELHKQIYRNSKEVKNQIAGSVNLDTDNNFMLPIINSGDGSVGNYRYTMSETAKETYMGKQDLAYMTMGRMQASIIDKVQTPIGNKRYLKEAKADYEEHYARNTKDFVFIGEDSDLEEDKERYRLLPESMKRDIRKMWGTDGMWVREETLDMVFGFRKLSIANIAPMPRQLKRVLHHAEIIWQSVVGRMKKNTVLFLPTILASNVVSNEHLLLISGVPLKYSLRMQKDAITFTNDYITTREKRDNLIRLIKANPYNTKVTDMEAKIARYNEELKRNPVAPLVTEGVFQNISEDIDPAAGGGVIKTLTKLYAPVNSFVEGVGEIAPDAFTGIYKQSVIAPGTEMNRLLTRATQYSDFLSRFALYKYQTEEQGIPHKEAIINVVDTFINYDVPTSPQVQWLNDMGIMMFTKFLFRIQRIILRSVTNQPLRVAALEAVQRAVGDIPDITDGVLSPIDLMNRSPGPVDIVDGAFNLNLLDQLDWLKYIFFFV